MAKRQGQTQRPFSNAAAAAAATEEDSSAPTTNLTGFQCAFSAAKASRCV